MPDGMWAAGRRVLHERTVPGGELPLYVVPFRPVRVRTVRRLFVVESYELKRGKPISTQISPPCRNALACPPQQQHMSRAND